MNKIMLIGNLGRDPEMSYTAGGQAMTKFSLAVSRRWKDESGERREETTWFNIVAWRQLAETCNNYLHKGSKVFIEGRMTSRKYTDKDGIERTVWDVTASDMEMLDPKGAGQGGAQGSGGFEDTSADDLPF
ncbi:MAG TPA: single-stranded DNA-binding protein [Ktedonobacterales bacterium]